jgi:TP901-1 family phage major tail protein
MRSAQLSGSGVFKDEASDERMRALFFAGAIPACQVVIPGFGTIQGPFQITAIDYAGTHDGEATFEVSLASAGALTFAALP